MDSNRSETAEYIELLTKYAETYLKNRDDLNILTDKVLEMNDGDLAKVKKSVFYVKTIHLAAERELTSYREERLENEKRLNQAGVGYDWIVNHVTSDIETKFRGQPTIIQELKKMQNSVKVTLRARATVFIKELDTMLVFHISIRNSAMFFFGKHNSFF